MEMMIERRADGDRRVPLKMPVALSLGEGDDTFEADAIDLSCGGLCMRAKYLPDVGSELACRFELAPSNACIEVRGEVVWAHLRGGLDGEFGVRFIEMADDAAALVAESLAERRALGRATVAAQARGPAGERMAQRVRPSEWDQAPPPTVQSAATRRPPSRTPTPPPAARPTHAARPEVEMALDAGGELSGQLAHESSSQAVFVQSLELLSVGQGLALRGADGHERRATIAGVSLRLNGATPVLAVKVAFDGVEPSFTDVPWELSRVDEPAPDPRGADPEHDTVPDVEPPTDRAAPRQRTTMSEYRAEREQAVHQARTVAAPASQLLAEYGRADVASGRSEPGLRAASRPFVESVAGSEAGADGAVPASAMPDRAQDDAGTFDLDWDDGYEEPRERHAPTTEGIAAGVQHDDAGASAAAGADQLAHLMGRAHERVVGQVQALSAHAEELAVAGRGKARVLGRTILTLAGRQRRRTTAGAARRRATTPAAPSRARSRPERVESSRVGRRLVMAMLASGAIALGVYAVAPRSGDGDLALPRPVAEGQDELAVAAPEEAEAVSVPESGSTDGPSAQKAVPKPASVPADSPYASTGQKGKPAATKRAAAAQLGLPAPTFGRRSVDNARSFKLRMTQPIKELQGIPDKGGFTVILPKTLSLDRAGPIALAHPAIQRSLILNKGNRAELTLRFAEGKSPDYRVQAHGSTLEILIAN